MMRGNLLILLVACTMGLAAQKNPVHVDVREKVKIKDWYFGDFVHQENGYFYTVGAKTRGFFSSSLKEVVLRKYSSEDFSLVEERKAKGFKYEGNRVRFREVVVNEKGFHVLFEAYDKGDDRKFLLCRKMSFADGLGPVKLLSSMESEKRRARKFIVKRSRDSSKTMVYNDVDEDGEVKLPHVSVYDENFEKLWDRRVTNPFDDNEVFRPTVFKVGNNGRLYILGYRTEKERSHKKARTTDQYGLLSFGRIEETLYDLKDLDITIHTVGMEPDVNGELLLVGLYSKPEEEHVTGSLYITMDHGALEPLNRRIEPFGEDFLANFNFKEYKPWDDFTGMFKGIATNKERGLESFLYRQFLIGDDGSVTVVAERSHESITVQDGMRWHYYHSDEIMPMHFGPTGKIEWLSLIPRRQTLVDRNFAGSYYLHQTGDNLHFVFNDIYTNKERLEQGEEMLPYGGSWSMKFGTVDVVLDKKNGTWDYEVLTIAKDLDQMLLDTKGLRTDDQTALGVYKSANEKKMRFVKYKF